MLNREALIQNSLPTEAPAFCSTPFWFVNGLEKSVKIGTQIFNYIDYLEAWCSIDCNTHRKRDHLDLIRDKISLAFKKVESKAAK